MDFINLTPKIKDTISYFLWFQENKKMVSDFSGMNTEDGTDISDNKSYDTQHIECNKYRNKR
ncbi:hypothetical protein ASV53_23645 [Photobacterium sanguinicancri]|uniref:Uncharacterized protein n=1 Tax=Photobacterium sanguinicancri TaxID=875932 RepID=A0ABX4FRM1_9GAMM|nr:hypothetical protein ASV53_23645 [Photobacterium sanguinicancri]